MLPEQLLVAAGPETAQTRMDVYAAVTVASSDWLALHPLHPSRTDIHRALLLAAALVALHDQEEQVLAIRARLDRLLGSATEGVADPEVGRALHEVGVDAAERLRTTSRFGAVEWCSGDVAVPAGADGAGLGLLELAYRPTRYTDLDPAGTGRLSVVAPVVVADWVQGARPDGHLYAVPGSSVATTAAAAADARIHADAGTRVSEALALDELRRGGETS